MASSGFVWISDTLTPNIKRLPKAFPKALETYLKSQAPAVQDYARQNAKWNDRTGNARQGLFAQYKGGNGSHVITVYHTVSYGIWLEVRWAGKYAIIEPTVRHEGARIFKGLRGLLERMS